MMRLGNPAGPEAGKGYFFIMKWERIIFATLGVIFLTLSVFTVVQLLRSGPVYQLFHPHSQQDVITQVFKNREIFSVIQSPQSATAQRLYRKYDSSGTLDSYDSSAPASLSSQQTQAIHSITLDGSTNGTLGNLSPREIQDLQNLANSSELDGYTRGALVGLSPQQIQIIQNLLGKPSSYHWGIGNNCIPDYGVLFNFRLQGHDVHVAFCFKCNLIGVFDGDDDSAEQINIKDQFDPMRSQLIALAKEIFPNDKEIQGLK
jgi:hypothetical protein